MSRVNLAIIGGGLVGASLALALQAGAKERGWKIVLIEPFAPGDSYQPSYDARSSALSYGARQIYQRLGIWQDISRRAEPIKQIHVSDRGRFSTARLSAMEEGVPALGYVVENAWLGQCLWQGLDRDVVSWRCPAEVTRMEPLPDGYRLTLNDETVLECDLAVLADGGRSGLREQLGIGVKTRPYNQSALIANITPSEAHQAKGVMPASPDTPSPRPCTSPRKTPRLKRSSACVTTPRWSMMTVAPVLVARTMGRSSSRARIRLICRCWSTAKVLPNQPMLLKFTSTVGAWAGSKNRAASSSPNKSS